MTDVREPRDVAGALHLRTRGSGPRLITASRIGQANRARVLQVLHTGGPASRAQLARELSVNRATIATILQPLIDTGALVEGPAVSAPVTGGKPARPLWFGHDGPMLGGVQISPDRVEAALMGIDGGIRLCESMDYGRTSTAEHLRAAIIAVTDKCFQGQEIIGIGVAASGMVNASTGQIISMHLTPALGGMEIGNILGSRFGVPVLVDHHPRVQALGDRWFGLGRNIQDFASVYTGEALGFGIVYCGEIVRGKDGAGGESGHTTVQLDGIQCRCGRNGCWETIATLGWLRETAGTLELPAAATMDCRQLVKLSREKVPDAEKLLDTYARNLAVGMANNEQVLASGTYIMHGDVCGGGEPMRLALKRWMHEFSPHRGVPPVILLAASPDQMSLLGGGGMVLSSAFSTIA